jgi:hypothetical protein
VTQPPSQLTTNRQSAHRDKNRYRKAISPKHCRDPYTVRSGLWPPSPSPSHTGTNPNCRAESTDRGLMPSVNSGLKAAGAAVFCWIYAEPDALLGVRSAPIVPKFVPKFSSCTSFLLKAPRRRSRLSSLSFFKSYSNRRINSLSDRNRVCGP